MKITTHTCREKIEEEPGKFVYYNMVTNETRYPEL
jgi:hypothetical protein